jgi:hypothetical protein
MNATHSRFVFSLLLTTSAALAQDDRARPAAPTDSPPAKAPVLQPAPSRGKVLAWLAREPLDTVVVLASWKELTFQVAGADLLADATIVKIAPATDAGWQVFADLPPKFACGGVLYVQAVGVKTRPALTIDAAPVQMVQIKAFADPDDGTVSDSKPGWSEDEQKALFASHLERMYACQMIWDLSKGTYGLYVEYTALTGGYALSMAGTRLVGGRLQVMVELRIPGPGEITTDVMEMHQLLVELGIYGKAMDVYVGITDGTRHTAFRPFGSFGPQ